MNSPGESISKKLGLLNSLLVHTEELLFSFALPEDIVKRYEALKNEVYGKIGISGTNNLWKMQREAHSKSLCSRKETSSQVNMYPEMEKVYKLKIAEVEQKIEGVKWETIQKIQKSHQIIEEYYHLSILMLRFIDNCSGSVSKLAGFDTEQYFQDDLGANDVSFTLNYESEYESILNDFKNLQKIENEKFVQVKSEFKLKENAFNHFFELVANEISLKDRKIMEYEAKLVEENDKYEIDSIAFKGKIKQFEEMLRQKEYDSQKQLQKEIEFLSKEQRKNEEILIKNYENQLETFQSEKEKLLKNAKKALEEQEKIQDNYIEIINKQKFDVQNAVSEKLLLLNQIEKFETFVNNLTEELSENRVLLTNERKLSEAIEAENYKLKSILNQNKEQFEYESNSIEKSYRTLIEKKHSDSQVAIKSLEDKIFYLQGELENKSNEIAKLYSNIEKIGLEKEEIFEMLSVKSQEAEEIFSNFQNISESNNYLSKELEQSEYLFKEIQEISKKLYFQLKSKPKENIKNYFAELLPSISELLRDKEWLIRKIEDLSNSQSKPSVKAKKIPEVSKPQHSDFFSATSKDSFKALKSFEKSRSEIISKFNTQT